jgi:uncharacterized protein
MNVCPLVNFAGRRLLFLPFLALLLTGCAGSPAPRYYSLNAALPAAPAPADNAHAGQPGKAIGIGPITLPEAVDRPQLVLSQGTGEVTLAQGHRWAGSLKQEIGLLLADHLTRRVGGHPPIAAYPQSMAVDAPYQVSLDITRFTASLGGETQIEALWTVRGGSDAPPLRKRGVYRAPVSGTGHAAVVAAYVQALLALGDDLAKDLAPLRPTPPGTAP